MCGDEIILRHVLIEVEVEDSVHGIEEFTKRANFKIRKIKTAGDSNIRGEGSCVVYAKKQMGED